MKGRGSKRMWAAGILIAIAGGLSGHEGFEVASVRPTPQGAPGRWIRMKSAHEFEAKNHSLRTLIAAAFSVSPQAISGGPAWIDSDRYDITAKAPGEARPSLDEQMEMLHGLLAERFQLKFHREPREMRIFALRIAKGGAKLKASEPAQADQAPPLLAFVIYPQLVKLPGRAANMAELVSVLQRAALPDPVVDETGLSGRYDFDLEFAPDESLFGGALGKGPEDGDRPGLYAAMTQQLGLRLESTRGSVQTLAVDFAARPSEN